MLRRFSVAVLLFALVAPSVSFAAFDPNDLLYPQQWYLRQIGAPLAWEETAGGPDVVVAVLDTGVDINHPDLEDRIWRNPDEFSADGVDDDKNGYVDDLQGWDFVTDTPDPRPSATPPFSRTALHHGTLVASIIAATGNNAEGIAGVAWRTRIMPLRVLNSQGQGDVSDVARAVHYAVDNGADIINLSFVGPGFSTELYRALRRAWEQDVVIVVAAGNTTSKDGGDLDARPLYPVCFDAEDEENWIIGVTATDTLDQRVQTANIGEACVDIAAPGTGMIGAQVFDPVKGLVQPYGSSWSGTSLAAPVVAGVAALVRAQEPSFTNTQVLAVITNNADDIRQLNSRIWPKLGAGRVNVARTLLGITSPDTPAPSAPVLEEGRIVALTRSARTPNLEFFTPGGELVRQWPVTAGAFRAGSIAVSENARLIPDDDEVNITAVIRGEQRIVVGERAGGQGRVRLFSPGGQLLSQWFAFDRPLGVGVSVAAGDVFGIGEGSVVAMPATGGGPQVRIFDRSGNVRSQFFAFAETLRGGWSVAVGDVMGNGQAEIIVSSTTAAALPVRVFSAAGQLLAEWHPYLTYRGPLVVAAGNVDGRGQAEVLTMPYGSGGPHVRVFSGQGMLKSQFFAFAEHQRHATRIVSGDIDADGEDEIAVVPVTGNPEVRLFDAHGHRLGQFAVAPGGRDARLDVVLSILR